MSNQNSKPFAVVTGASSGIGYALAAEFARNGFDLLIAAEDSAIADAARNLSTGDARVESLQVDLAEYEGVEKLYNRIQSTGRAVDAIALNAGVGVGGDFTRGTDLDAELNLININVVSPVHLVKRVAKDMVDRKQGKILFTSSIAATMPAPFEAVYGASKAFLLSFSEALRNELKDTGVTVTALMPGVTDTNFFRRAGMDNTKAGAGEKDDPAQVAREGFEAMMAGKDKVIAGAFMNAVQGYGSRLIPDVLKAEMHRSLAEPGSAQK